MTPEQLIKRALWLVGNRPPSESTDLLRSWAPSAASALKDLATIAAQQRVLAEQAEPVLRIRSWTKNGEGHGDLVDWLKGSENLPDGEYDLYLGPQSAQKPVASIYISPNGEREFDDWKHDLPIGRNELFAATVAQPATEQAEAPRFPSTQYPLPDDLYDSKDWRAGSYPERVEWLHCMYEAKKRELDVKAIPVYQMAKSTGPTSTCWIDCDEATYNSANLYPDEYRTRTLYLHPPRQDAEQAADAALPDGVVISAYRLGSDVNCIKIERVMQLKGPDTWAVRLHSECLNAHGEWEWEPMPSGRDDAFLSRCRFATACEAIDAASEAKEKL